MVCRGRVVRWRVLVVDEEYLREKGVLRLDMHSIKWWAGVGLHGV